MVVEDKEEAKEGERKLEDSKGAKSYVFEAHNIVYRVSEWVTHSNPPLSHSAPPLTPSYPL